MWCFIRRGIGFRRSGLVLGGVMDAGGVGRGVMVVAVAGGIRLGWVKF